VIELFAPAKLTWFLEVTRRREDGYHELRAEMTTLAFGDSLVLDESANYLTIEGADVAADSTNLVTRALALVGRRAGVHLVKRIPPGGGLGGGSADAAAILRWAGGVDAAAALSLGADVPFCLVGGRALVEGVGEKVTALAYEERAVTLLLPSFAVNTAQVFRAYDDMASAGAHFTQRNHLEAPAIVVEPRLGATLAWARDHFGDVTLAGSGSTMFIGAHVDPTRGSWHEEGPAGPVRVVQTTTTP
jgi:4-diphosphocytidyl-2-C-methyl-D-erythritol kinase